MGIVIGFAGCGGHRDSSKSRHAASASGSGMMEVKTGVVIDGVRFNITAEPVQFLKGWGVGILVSVASDDGLDHWLEKNPFFFEGSYTKESIRHGFGTGGAMEIPPDRIRIKPGKEKKFPSILPVDDKNEGVENGGSMEFVIKVTGMISTEGNIIKPEVAHVKFKVSKKGKLELSVESVNG